MKQGQSIIDESLRYFLFQHDLDGLTAVSLNAGLSNRNFLLGGKYVLKVSYDPDFILLNPSKDEFQNEAAMHFLAPKVICSDYKKGYQVTEYLPSYRPLNSEKATALEIKNAINAIKAIHALNPLGLEELNYEKMLDSYRLKVPPKERIYIAILEESSLLLDKKEIAHFDLTADNILLSKEQKAKIVDFEFACLAPKYFDLASLLGENSFDPKTQELIMGEYFHLNPHNYDDFKKKRGELVAIADLLWYHWAKARSLTCPTEKKKAYIQIAEDKKKSLYKYLSLINI
jgi:thiamine kinase-like enzyme